MADLMTIAGGLASALESIPALAHRVSDTAPDRVQTPWAWVTLAADAEGGQYDAVLGNVAWWYFDVVVAAGRAGADRRAQTALYGYLSSTGAASVKQAIEADPTLGGAAHTLLVETPSNEAIRSDQMELLGARWRVRVLA